MSVVEIHRAAPDIEMEDYRGEHFSLKEYQGKKWVFLVLNRGFS